MNAPFNPNNPDSLPVQLHKFKSDLWLQIEDRINLLKGNKERIKQHIMAVIREEADTAFGKPADYWDELVKKTWSPEWEDSVSVETVLTPGSDTERLHHIWTMAVLYARERIDDMPIEELFEEDLI